MKTETLIRIAYAAAAADLVLFVAVVIKIANL